MSALFWLLYQSNTSLKEQRSSVHSLSQVLSKGAVLIQGNLLRITVNMGVLRFKVLVFDQFYSPMEHYDSFRINIAIADMHRLTAMILDVNNAFQNTNVPIHERVCVSPPPYYLDLFESSYPYVPLNRDDGPFCL